MEASFATCQYPSFVHHPQRVYHSRKSFPLLESCSGPVEEIAWKGGAYVVSFTWCTYSDFIILCLLQGMLRLMMCGNSVESTWRQWRLLFVAIRMPKRKLQRNIFHNWRVHAYNTKEIKRKMMLAKGIFSNRIEKKAMQFWKVCLNFFWYNRMIWR